MFRAVRRSNGMHIDAIGVLNSNYLNPVSDLLKLINNVYGTDYKITSSISGSHEIYEGSFLYPLDENKPILVYDFQMKFRSFKDLDEIEKYYDVTLDHKSEEDSSQRQSPHNKVIHQQLRVDFSDPKSVKDLMNNYSSVNTMLFGTNQDGETQTISIAKDSVVVVTYQNNHYVRTNHYDSNGICVAEMYDSEF